MATAPITYEFLSFLIVLVSILVSFYFGNRYGLKNNKKELRHSLKYFGISFILFVAIFILSALNWGNPFLTLKPLLIEFVFGFVALFAMFKLKTKLVWKYVFGILIFVVLSFFLAELFIGRNFLI